MNLDLINFLGMLVLLGGTAFLYWRRGYSDIDKRGIDAYKSLYEATNTQLGLIQKENVSIRERLQSVEKELVALRITVEEKDKKIKEYMDILSLKDPDMTKFFKDGIKTMDIFLKSNPKMETHMEQTEKAILEIKKYITKKK